MLGRKSRPAIGNLITGDRSGLMDLATSPRSPLEFKIRSPRNLINYDAGKVGLGIVATLGGGETPAGKPLYGRNMSRSDPIPVKTAKNSGGIRGGFEEMDSLEEYTFVTCHGPEKSYTRVYGKNGHERDGFDRRLVSGKPKSSRGGCVFDISPARLGDFPAYPSSDFLSSCDLCRKKLHGKDIYMYRGERAFCSTECRYRQIVMDERKEKCSSEASRSSSAAAAAAAADVSSNSPYTNGHQFLRGGILAI